MNSTNKICLRDQNQFYLGEEESEKSRRFLTKRNFPDTEGKTKHCYRNSREKRQFNFKISDRKMEQIDESIPITIRNYFIQESLANKNASTIKY